MYKALFGVLGSFFDPPPVYEKAMRQIGYTRYFHYIALY